jgi:hypothetical protein
LVIGLLCTSTFWIADLKALPGTAAPATDGIADHIADLMSLPGTASPAIDGIADHKAKVDANATAQLLLITMPLSIPTQYYCPTRSCPASVT